MYVVDQVMHSMNQDNIDDHPFLINGLAPHFWLRYPELTFHYIIDWNYDEDRSRIRTGFGPENVTRLRRFAVGILKSFQKPSQSIAEMMRLLSFRTRLVFDYLRMTKNSLTGSRAS